MSAFSGAFSGRSERKTLEFKSTTANNVGPGSYITPDTHAIATSGATVIGDGLMVVNPAPVPFHTSSDRTCVENLTTAAITPGPGAYASADVIDLLKGTAGTVTHSGLASTLRRPQASSSFASIVDRLPEAKEEIRPGPGKYPPGNSWIKKSHRVPPSDPGFIAGPVPGKSSPHLTASQHLLLSRLPSSPSIPARHQSHGYEENPDGSLIMQQNPERVFTGEGQDRPGPGDYDPVAVIRGAGAGAGDRGAIGGGKAPTWSSSRTKRVIKEFNVGISPGPAAYQPKFAGVGATGGNSGMTVMTVGGVEVTFGGAQGTASFASKSSRPHQVVPPDEQIGPGPGSYDIASKNSIGMKANQNRSR
eukprot:CAMPEP_0175061116 /NCGR_PEP_ID=MMETSP0052_2-20121109/13408_1 /TAXON_ID=51329 ORGANISM="Polytomella parva, Strain SAG 63-3" /NCGR_SAMPLE_ID=MMETSP0052_2 /ASSEMBLY_ACC=CAM_ASM_000194 /LENGTH=360 /DNA_ID=CAMNT_0016326939 /DNA_START=73 /DNA_END=1151 /DNA_ORIENTATION=+